LETHKEENRTETDRKIERGPKHRAIVPQELVSKFGNRKNSNFGHDDPDIQKGSGYDDIEQHCRNAKLDYFQRKRNQNETTFLRVKTAEDEYMERRKRENNKLQWEANNLLDLAQSERDSQFRKKQESQLKEAKKDIDYKLILRDARRAERSDSSTHV